MTTIVKRRTLLAGACLTVGVGVALGEAMPRTSGGEGALKEFKRLHVAEYINAVAWNADASRLAALSYFGSRITVWDTQDWRVVNAFERYSGSYAFNSLAYLPDGTLLTAAPIGKTRDEQLFALIQWDTEKGTPIRHIPDANPRLGFDIRNTDAFVVSPDGTLVAGIMEGSRDGRVLVFDTGNWTIAHSFVSPPTPLHPDRALCLAFSPDSKEIAVGTIFGFVHVFAIGNDRPILSFLAYHGDVPCYAIAYDTKGEVITTGRGAVTARSPQDGRTNLWNSSNGTPLASLVGGGGNVYSLSYSKSDLLAAAYDLSLLAWEANSNPPSPILNITSGSFSVKFSPGGVLAAAQNNAVALYKAE